MPRRPSQKVSSRPPSRIKPVRSLIPIGTATLLPDAAQRVRNLEGVLLNCLATWGYREIIPPTFEYLDVLSEGLPPEILEKCYKFADWTTGRILVLRPDVTAQIARIVAMGMGGAGLPLRLCYRTTVFRYEPEHAGREREVFQVGIELIGADDATMDAEIITLLIEALKVVGLTEFKVSLGHVGFYKALLTRSGMSEEGRKQAELAAAHKDIPRLERILTEERVSRKHARMVLEAPGRYGREEVLEWGRRVAGRDRTLTQPLDRLTHVYRLLEATGVKDHLLLDLGEFRGFDYYDGLVFDVFTGHLGSELGGGGRYNHLIGRFGQELPSTGFALDMDRLFSSLDGVGQGSSHSQATILVAAPLPRYGQAFTVTQMLRGTGMHVIQEAVQKPYTHVMRDARHRAALLAINKVVLLGIPGLGPKEALVMTRVPTRRETREQKVKIQDLLNFLEAHPHASV